MNQFCTSCKKKIENSHNQFVTNGLCLSCAGEILSKTENTQIFLNALKSPTLLMQSEPRQVVTANKKACEMFDKDLTRINGYRGGQVFDCLHSFTEAGCGKDINCENCKIKNSVVETFATGKSCFAQTILDIRKTDRTTPYNMQISTEKIGDFALINIGKYEKT